MTTFKTKSQRSDVFVSQPAEVGSVIHPHVSTKTQPVTDKVAPLIGRKSLLKCSISGYAVTVLLDTGADVSILDRTWKEKYLPYQDIRPLSELTDKELDIPAITGDKIRWMGRGYS